MGLKANMSRIVGQNVEELDLPICRGILANMSTNFWLVRADSYPLVPKGASPISAISIQLDTTR